MQELDSAQESRERSLTSLSHGAGESFFAFHEYPREPTVQYQLVHSRTNQVNAEYSLEASIMKQTTILRQTTRAGATLEEIMMLGKVGKRRG